MRPAAAAFVALAVLATAASSYYAFRPESSGTIAFWVFAGVPQLVLGAAAVAWARREELLREWLTPQWGDFTRGILGAAIYFALALAFVRLVAPPASPRAIWLVSLYGQLGDPRILQQHAPAIAITIAAVSLAEEVLWRGAVTQMLAEAVGSRTAGLWAAGLYALSYVPAGWSLRSAAGGDGGYNPVLVLAALGGGLLWGGMARAFGRLTPGVLAHAAFDWAVVMMFPLWGLR
jgi:membrane protease YdiL (CAAX protease family)